MKHSSLLSSISMVPWMTAVIADSCEGPNPLMCENNGECLNGDKPYSDLGISKAFDFLIPSIRGMHCFCPSKNVTGVRCEIPYETCNSETICFHGGYCASEQYNIGSYHCVCPMDDNGGVWAGKHCEVPATNFCTDNMVWDIPGGRWFCTNGGICQNGVRYVFRIGDGPRSIRLFLKKYYCSCSILTVFIPEAILLQNVNVSMVHLVHTVNTTSSKHVLYCVLMKVCAKSGSKISLYCNNMELISKLP